MAFLDESGLSYLWSKLKNKFFPISGGKVLGDVELIQYGSFITRTDSNELASVMDKNGIQVTDTNGNAVRLCAKNKENGELGAQLIFPATFNLANISIGDAEYDDEAATLGQIKSLIAESSGGGNSVSITLNSSDWEDNEQTVTVDGVLADEAQQMITPVPSNDSQDDYYSCGVVCKSQAENSLTFKADEVPTSNLTVYVILQGV